MAETWTNPNTGLPFGSYASTGEALEGLRGLAGDIGAFRTPSEDWARLRAGMRPFWEERAPMSDLAGRMMGRYYLGSPYLETAQQPNISFADYLTGFAGPTPARTMADLETLRERARRAGLAGITPQGIYEAGAATPEEFAIRGRYGSLFGPAAEQQAANQLAVAQTLALQKAGGGAYRGRMADAIRNAMQRTQRHQAALGQPRGSFLDWYMGRYHPESATGQSVPATRQAATNTSPTLATQGLGAFT